MERQLQRLTWSDIKELVPGKVDTIIFPIGTVEAHGVAALGTDNFIPEAISLHLAEKIDALVAPTLNYGITRSLYGYPGSLTVTPATFKKLVYEILKSLHDVGFRKVIIMNGHGGNNAALKDAALEYFAEYQVKIAVIHWWELCMDMTRQFFGEHGGHAALDETAMMQAIDEKLVKRSLYSPEMAYEFREGADIYPVPGTILLYEKGQGYPSFDSEQAGEFKERVFSEIVSFVKMVLSRWEQI